MDNKHTNYFTETFRWFQRQIGPKYWLQMHDVNEGFINRNGIEIKFCCETDKLVQLMDKLPNDFLPITVHQYNCNTVYYLSNPSNYTVKQFYNDYIVHDNKECLNYVI